MSKGFGAAASVYEISVIHFWRREKRRGAEKREKNNMNDITSIEAKRNKSSTTTT